MPKSNAKNKSFVTCDGATVSLGETVTVKDKRYRYMGTIKEITRDGFCLFYTKRKYKTNIWFPQTAEIIVS